MDVAARAGRVLIDARYASKELESEAALDVMHDSGGVNRRRYRALHQLQKIWARANIEDCFAILIRNFDLSEWSAFVLGTYEVIDDVEHRGLLIPLDLRMNNWNHVDYDPLTRKMLVHKFAFNENVSARWLGSTRHVLGNLLHLYPLVVYHSRDVHHQYETGSSRAACYLSTTSFLGTAKRLLEFALVVLNLLYCVTASLALEDGAVNTRLDFADFCHNNFSAT